MDVEDAAWLCTQAIADDRGPDDGNKKANNFGCIVLNDTADNECYILKEGDNTIGRHPLNHIYIEHPSVSTNHAVIQCDCDGVVLLDKGSLNKTKLNKKTLKKNVAYFLDENALLVFGEVRADYYADGYPKSNRVSTQTKTENVGFSISKTSNSVITSNSSTSKMEINVPKTITKSEYSKNILDDEEQNSSNSSDQFFLDAICQIETMESNGNLSEIIHNIREETPSPEMDLGIFDNSENRLSMIETDNHILSINESTNNIDINETQCLEIDNIFKNYTQQSPANTSIKDNQQLLDSNLVNFTPMSSQQNITKTYFNTFEADDDDIFSSIIDLESKSQMPDLISHNTDFFDCHTQKVLITKKTDVKSKVPSTIHEIETQELPRPNKTNVITSKMDDEDFFNHPSQKSLISEKGNSKANWSSTMHEIETQRLLHPDITNVNTYETSTKNIHKSPTEVAKIDDEDFFNCPTQKVPISEKINTKTNDYSTLHKTEMQILQQPSVTNLKALKTNTTNLRANLTEIQKIDDEDFFNCPTQKVKISENKDLKSKITSKHENKSFFNSPTQEVSISKNKNLKTFISSNMHKSETQEFLQPIETDLIPFKKSITDIDENLTKIQEIDDEDFFDLPTQKLSISKIFGVKEKCSLTLQEVKTQEISQFLPNNTNVNISKANNNNTIHKELTQIRDKECFNCTTQKVSISNEVNSKCSTICETETQECIQPNETNVTNKCEDLTKNHKMVDDFFNCPTQKVPIYEKINLKANVYPTLHKTEIQICKQPSDTNLKASKINTSNIHENLTEIQKMDDEDFFNCPTQRVPISKKNNFKTKMQTFQQPSDANLKALNTNTSNIRENLTEIDDEDFFDLPTQKLSISKIFGVKEKCSLTLQEIKTEEISQVLLSNTNVNISKSNNNKSIHKELTRICDEESFNCTTQKVSISNEINSKCSSTICETETQECIQPNETNIITSKTNIINKCEDLTKNNEMVDDDFFNCPTQKISIPKKVNSSIDTKRYGINGLDINDSEPKDLLLQLNSTIPISKINSPNKIKRNKENICDQTQKVLTTIQSNTISHKCINSNIDVTENCINNYDEYKLNNQKQIAVSDQLDEYKIQKSENVDLNNQMPDVVVNQRLSIIPEKNEKPIIRVRKDLQTPCSVNLSNGLSNKTNNKSVQNILLHNNTTNGNIVSLKEELLTDYSVGCQVANSKHKHQSRQTNETILNPFKAPNKSSNLLSNKHLIPITIGSNIDSLNNEQYTSSSYITSKCQSFSNNASQNQGKFSKQLKNINNTNEVVAKKERYQTRAVTRKENSVEFNRKRKQDSVNVNLNNKRICNANRSHSSSLLDPLTESSLEVVVTFSYLKNRHLQEMKQFIDKTGGSITDEITQCTVLVTDKIRCTMKILSAIAMGCPIVNTNWIKHSYTVKSFQDVREFIITDKDAERKYNFRLKESLAKARINRLLDGYTVLVTPSVKPGPKDMKVIITCAGGEFVVMWPKTRARNELIVTCEQDRRRWKPIWNNDTAKIIDSNTLVISLIRQKLNI